MWPWLLFYFERESARTRMCVSGGGGAERERLLSRIHAQYGAQRGAPSDLRTPEVMT